MGEIGRDRTEFLSEMTYCDILLIQRGYRRRNVLQYQLQRLQAYGAFFCMSGTNKKPSEWIDLYFDHYKGCEGRLLSEDDKEELQSMMREINKRKKKENDGN